MNDLISRALAQTELQMVAKRYSISSEAGGYGNVLWSENLISITDAMNALRNVPTVECFEWNTWAEHDDRLKDNYYYLVTHKDYDTPMKAKYHGNVPRFDILGGNNEVALFFDGTVTAWMELPDIYRGSKDE